MSMMPRANSKGVLGALLASVIGGIGAMGPAAHASPKSAVSIGEVKISVGAGIEGAAAIELGRSLRAALDDELRQLTALGRHPRPLIVSATVTRLSSEKTGAASTASAAISLALLRADDRVLFAELRGRASVEETSVSLSTLRSMALRRATQRALERLPEAMQRAD
jgi:hypothetical protein